MFNCMQRRFVTKSNHLYPYEIPVNVLHQRGFLIENLPKNWLMNNEKIKQIFYKCGINITDDSIYIQRNRFGVPCGRCMVLTENVLRPNFEFNIVEKKDKSTQQFRSPEDVRSTKVTSDIEKSIVESLPQSARTYVCDEHDVSCFVEQCERYLMQSVDLRKLSQSKNFKRTVTISGLNKSYGRLELAFILKHKAAVIVDPSDIIFRFKNNGEQDSTAWVICKTENEANRILSHIQELEIPKRYQYGSLMGASFLYSARNSLFLSHPEIDFKATTNKYQIFTTGWQHDVDEEDLLYLFNNLRFFPKSVKMIRINTENPHGFDVGAFIECDRMKNTKKIMMRLGIIKRRWKIPSHSILFAYPRQADVHWESENGSYKDEDLADDSDLDEPIEY